MISPDRSHSMKKRSIPCKILIFGLKACHMKYTVWPVLAEFRLISCAGVAMVEFPKMLFVSALSTVP